MNHRGGGSLDEAVVHRFTDHAKSAFLEELARTGNVTASARVSDVSRVCVYWHRERDEEFAEAWEDALQQATDRLELEARRRAHDGYEEPVFYQGVEVGGVRKYSDQLMIQLLKAHHPAHRNTINHKHDLGGGEGQAEISFSWRSGPAAPVDESTNEEGSE